MKDSRKDALFLIAIGIYDGEDVIYDNWRKIKVIAKDVQKAVQKAKLEKHEYVVSVEFLGRED